MRRIFGPGFLALGILTSCLLGLSQEHPPIAPGAKETTAKQLHSMLGQSGKILVIDVRTPSEYAKGHIPEAINIPINGVSIPRQSRGPYYVSRSKRLFGVANAAPSFWGHPRVAAYQSPI